MVIHVAQQDEYVTTKQLAAYVLYGKASENHVVHGSENIFERRFVV